DRRMKARVHRQKLKYRASAAVTRPLALHTSSRFPQLQRQVRRGLYAQAGEFGARIGNGDATFWTQPAHKTLREYGRKRGREQVRLNAEINQAGNRADGVVGVQGRGNEMAGECCAHQQARRLTVKGFTQ